VVDEMTLLAGVRRLDPQALAEAHDKYYPAIFRFVAYKVGNQETAEDLTSDVFVRLLDAVRDRHAPQNTLRGWLYSVASHVVSDYHRKKYRGNQEVDLLETIESDVSGPAEETIKKQTLEALSAALGELTEEQQNVIALRFGYEMPIKEVAEIIGKSEGAVKQLQARAVAALALRMMPTNRAS
jgi:RNA polymerase sigma-70 factor, ECF subfamily